MRVRVRFTKHGKVRFTSHRDTARVWERTFRKAGVALAYSEGFSPRPKLHFGLALSTGYASNAEYVDADLANELPLELVAEVPDRLTECLPVGMAATAIGILEPGATSLQQAVTSCSWQIHIVDRDPPALRASVARALAADQLLVTRTRKGTETTDDIRPFVVDLAVGAPTDQGTELFAELRTQPRSLRPAELLQALDPPADPGLVIRTHQWTEHDGARHEPLPAPADPTGASASAPVGAAFVAPHASARAS